MKLDVSHLRYMEADDFRILSALEAGSRNHELVPIDLVSKFTGIRSGGLRKKMADLARHRLFSFEQEGVRLGYGGYDYLALNALLQRGSVVALGNQIGVGKESDIYLADNDKDECVVIKLQRLGRTSFRTVKTNRDYHGKRQHISWIYLSKLAAQREWEFMGALWERGFSIPKPLDTSRHVIVMERIVGRRLDDFLRDEVGEEEAKDWLRQCLEMLTGLAKIGLVHGDLNEFNIMVQDNDELKSSNNRRLVMIDFPQMISVKHKNAREYFDRDYQGLISFFGRVFLVESSEDIDFDSLITTNGDAMIDELCKASGYKHSDNNESSEVECQQDDSEVDDKFHEEEDPS